MVSEVPLNRVKVLVTGAAGFIGSHLVDALMENGCTVVAFDNLSTGRIENLAQSMLHPRFTFIQGDLLNPLQIESAPDDCETVFHLAANPEVRVGVADTKIDLEQNVIATKKAVKTAYLISAKSRSRMRRTRWLRRLY